MYGIPGSSNFVCKISAEIHLKNLPFKADIFTYLEDPGIYIYIYIYIYHKNHIGKYTMHGSYMGISFHHH